MIEKEEIRPAIEHLDAAMLLATVEEAHQEGESAIFFICSLNLLNCRATVQANTQQLDFNVTFT